MIHADRVSDFVNDKIDELLSCFSVFVSEVKVVVYVYVSAYAVWRGAGEESVTHDPF